MTEVQNCSLNCRILLFVDSFIDISILSLWMIGCNVWTGLHPQLCHQLSELVNSSKQMSSSLSQCLAVFIQQDQVAVVILLIDPHSLLAGHLYYSPVMYHT